MRTRRIDRGGDDGVVLIIVAIVAALLMLMVGMTLEFGAARDDRQTNKSAADHATTAGLRGLDSGAGTIQPWQGVCAAKAFLEVNNDKFAGMVEQFEHGDGASLLGGGVDGCDPSTNTRYLDICVPSTPSSWAVYRGTTTDGRVEVEIRSGYVLPDPSFPDEDSDLLGDSDTGDPVKGGCDHLAVIVRDRNPQTLSAARRSGELSTTVRSVGRVAIGTSVDATVALLMLERHDCGVIVVQGSSGAQIKVAGFGDNPGLIHSDSDGSGSGCNSGDAQNGNIFQVNGNPPFSGSNAPRIIAGPAETPVGAEAAGFIGSYALEIGAPSGLIASPVPTEVCAAETATGCGEAPTGKGPEPKSLVTRAPLDGRYRTTVIALRGEAEQRLAWDAAAAAANGFTVRTDCGGGATFTAARVFVDCGGGVFRGNGSTFTSTVDEIVINGSVAVDGNGNTLTIHSPDKLYVKGSSTANAVELKGSNNRILLNQGGSVDGDADGFVCDDRAVDDPTALTKLVIGDGPLVGEGGSGKVLRMCQTFVFMADDADAANQCEVPSVDGVAPWDNTCRGRVRVAGNNALDWSAPNVNPTTDPTPGEIANFEDLAFWSETSGSGTSITSIEGGGGVRLVGIFFVPNAKPARVGGNGAYDIQQAQFLTRRLEVAGNGTLLMRPNPVNALPVPFFRSFTLVR